MIEAAVSTRVDIRDQFGRFQAAMDKSATEAVYRTAVEGARISRRLAASGPPRRDYARRHKLNRTITAYQLDSRTAVWGSTAGHALPQERGARPHVIAARNGHNLVFRGRKGLIVTPSVNHPGNRAQPYLAPSVRALRGRVNEILRAAYN